MCPFCRHWELFWQFFVCTKNANPKLLHIKSYTRLKINMSLKRGPFQKGISSSNHSFQRIFVCLKLMFWGFVTDSVTKSRGLYKRLSQIPCNRRFWLVKCQLRNENMGGDLKGALFIRLKNLNLNACWTLWIIPTFRNWVNQKSNHLIGRKQTSNGCWFSPFVGTFSVSNPLAKTFMALFFLSPGSSSYLQMLGFQPLNSWSRSHVRGEVERSEKVW